MKDTEIDLSDILSNHSFLDILPDPSLSDILSNPSFLVKKNNKTRKSDSVSSEEEIESFDPDYNNELELFDPNIDNEKDEYQNFGDNQIFATSNISDDILTKTNNNNIKKRVKQIII
ncbi:28952_t:CDS:2 [Racocetra persica]|uniref:28952_t:CDS:1 n=1 Tax=Racocetra persica TaxID=160502 RepID=A0ACA9M870_9GLOM|nr:28952_t:CDS:2 [Racocetra persica]